MKKRILTLALVAALALMAVPAAHADWVMYVSPAAGTTVNLRSTPDVHSNNLITQVPYGTPLMVKYISNGWACIDYGVGAYDEAFMMVKYLTYDYVPPTADNMRKKTVNTDTTSTTNRTTQRTTANTNDMTSQFNAMNEQFRTFQLVSRSFSVYAKPSRATGWVNLRYAPNEKAEMIRQVRLNEQLIVIGQTARWYQVEDPASGIVGYISRQYVSTNPN